MSLRATIQDFLPFTSPPERRDPEQIDADLDDEFAFHLDMAARELIEQGHAPDVACELARARFGDLNHIKATCRRIALKEHIMLQRINLVMMIIVLVSVVIVAIQMYITQRYNTLALQDITTQLSKMRMMGGADAQAPAVSDDKQVLVEGAVERPGWYPIRTSNGATYLHEVLELARLKNTDSVVTRSTRGRSQQTFELREISPDALKIVLLPEDRIRIYTQAEWESYRASSAQRTEPEAGIWKQVDSDGNPVADGLTMHVIGPEDIRNLTRFPLGTIRIDDKEWQLQFMGGTENNLRIELPHVGSFLSRWQRTGERILFNISPISSKGPVELARVKEGP